MTATEAAAPSVTAPAVELGPTEAASAARTLPRWPLVLIAAPAAIAVWSGWVGLGLMCGFGVVHPLPGIVNGLSINSAISLPVGVEAYGAYAMGAWLHPGTPADVRRFARNSALGSLALGMGGQVIYHLLTAWGIRVAPWPVVTLVSCLPVLTLGFGAALTHLLHAGHAAGTPPAEAVPAAVDEPDTSPDTEADSTTDTTTDNPPAANRTRRARSTAARVATMQARHPDESPAELAARLKLSDRTVRRYLSPPPAASAQTIGA